MDKDLGLAVSIVTATTGIAAKIAADTRLSVQDRAFVAAYNTKLGSADTTEDEDMRFKFVFDQWFIASLMPRTT